MLEDLYIRKIIMDKDFDDASYIAGLPVVKYLLRAGEICLNKPVTFFAGENGTGKSTLIEAVAVCAGFNAEGGSRNFNFSTNATESPLCRYITLTKGAYEKDGYFLRAESFYNVASNIEALDSYPSGAPFITDAYGGKSLHCQSHGEALLALVENRFRGQGLYILDEPEAGLSPLRQMLLLSEINRLVRAGSQFLIATHSPILLCFPGACIYELGETGLHPVEYDKTGHYTVTKQFLDNPHLMMKHLFEEKE